MRRGLLGALTSVALAALAAPASAAEPERDAFATFPLGGVSAADVLRGPPAEAVEAWERAESLLESRFLPAPSPTVAEDPATVVGNGPDGGPGVAHHAGAVPVASPPDPVPSGIQRSVGHPTFEPSLGITSDGSVFFLAIRDAEVPMAIILRSRDKGEHWEVAPRGLNGETPTEDPLIYVDPRTDRLFDAELTLPCSLVYRSDDRGDTFTQFPICNHADHQTLFAGPPPAGGMKPTAKYPDIVYYCAIDGGASVAAGITACSKSLDGGTTWLRTLTPAYVSDGSQPGGSLGIPGFCYGATGHGRVGPDGTVYLPRGFCQTPTLAISHDEGNTWKHVVVSKTLGIQVGTSAGVGLEEHEARVAIDPAGNVYYFWIAQDHLPYLAVMRKGAGHFDKPMMVAPPGVNETWGPALDAGATGRVAFSYLATTNSPGGPFCTMTTPTSCTTADGSEGKPESAYANTTWSGYIGMTVDALADDPTFYSAPVNDPSDPYTRGVCGSVQCEPTHEFHGLSIGPDGTPYTSFADGCTPNPADGCDASVGVLGRLVGGPPLR